MRIVVTGGCGFIGSHVVDRLVEAGHDVAVVDLRQPHRADVAHYQVDIADLPGLVRATQGAEVVFHLAAVADVNDVTAAPVETTEANIVGTAKVWEACRINGVRRAILASTVWVYNGAPEGDTALDEDESFRLADVGHLYTSSKLSAELVAHSYHTLYGQEFTILRYGIPYGPRMRDSLVIPRFVRMALAGEPLTIQGDGTQYRNYVYVEDLADAHVLALQAVAANEVFNLEGREKVSIRDLVGSIGGALGRTVDVEYRPARAGDYGGREISAAKAEGVLGWSPQVSFEEGLRRYVVWHLDQPPAAEPVPVRAPVAEIRPVAGTLAGLGLASLALPALAVTAGTSPLAAALAGAGSLGAAMAARVAARRRIPLVVSGAVSAATVWLLAQAPPGPISLLLGLLLGLSVGAGLAGMRWGPSAWVPATAGGGALVMTALVNRPGLFWLGAALAGAAPLGALMARVAGPLRLVHRRVSWAMTTTVVLVTVLTASWVGATSASADWFGSVISHGSRHVPEVAVTFDGVPDGPTGQRIMAALDAHAVKATFFATGRDVEARPDVVRALLDDHQLVANNAYGGNPGAFLDPRYGQLRRAQEAFAREVGVCPTYFRPPQGRHTPLMARVVHHNGMAMVTWDVLVGAPRDRSTASVVVPALAKVRSGSIVAFRLDPEGSPGVADALPLVLRGLQDRNLESVRLDRLLHLDGYAGHC